LDQEEAPNPMTSAKRSQWSFRYCESCSGPLEKNRRDASCCGAGGGVKSEFSEWSVEMARDRILEAKEIGAEILVSTCPFCNRNFLDAKKEFNLDIEIYDLTELLIQHI